MLKPQPSKGASVVESPCHAEFLLFSVMSAFAGKAARSVRVITADLRRSGITCSNLEMADGGRNDPSPRLALRRTPSSQP